jgi:hypothetical protein
MAQVYKFYSLYGVQVFHKLPQLTVVLRKQVSVSAGVKPDKRPTNAFNTPTAESMSGLLDMH